MKGGKTNKMKDEEAEGEKAYNKPTKSQVNTVQGNGRDKTK